MGAVPAARRRAARRLSGGASPMPWLAWSSPGVPRDPAAWGRIAWAYEQQPGLFDWYRRAHRPADRRRMDRRPRWRPPRGGRPRHRGRADGGRRRHRGGRAGGGERGPRGPARLGGHAAPAARRMPAPRVRADDGARRADRPADVRGERQGAAGRPRRAQLRGRVLPLVRRRGRADRREPGHRARGGQQDPRHPAADRRLGAGHALELPGRDGHQEARPGAGRGLHGGAEARRGDAADRAGRGRAARRGRGARAGSSTSCRPPGPARWSPR